MAGPGVGRGLPSSGSGCGPLAGSCHGNNKLSGFIKWGNFLTI